MSSEVKTKEKVNMDPKYLIKLAVTLCVTCVIVAAALGAVDNVTRVPIAEANRIATEKALSAVFPDVAAPEFPELELTDAMTSAASAAGATLENVYEVKDGGETAGYAVKIIASGSQGNIEMVVGVDAEGAVTGVSIVSNAETSGIGSKVMKNNPLPSGTGVLDQFIGKSAADGTLSVGSNVDAISGATVSSRGVTTGVNGAIAAAGAIG